MNNYTERVKNLGQIAAIAFGTTPPNDKRILWYDEGETADVALKYYSKEQQRWIPFPSMDFIQAVIDSLRKLHLKKVEGDSSTASLITQLTEQLPPLTQEFIEGTLKHVSVQVDVTDGAQALLDSTLYIGDIDMGTSESNFVVTYRTFLTNKGTSSANYLSYEVHAIRYDYDRETKEVSNITFIDDTGNPILLRSSIVNNLTTTSTILPLSAAQGKVLKDLIDTYKVKELIDGNVTVVTLTNYKAKIDVTVDNSSIVVEEKALRVKRIDGGTFS